ncbi:MAG: InlB B-repeat-containing protein [Halothermotrichaceae bacterium]
MNFKKNLILFVFISLLIISTNVFAANSGHTGPSINPDTGIISYYQWVDAGGLVGVQENYIFIERLSEVSYYSEMDGTGFSKLITEDGENVFSGRGSQIKDLEKGYYEAYNEVYAPPSSSSLYLTIRPYFNLSFINEGGSGQVDFSVYSTDDSVDIHTIVTDRQVENFAKAGDEIHLSVEPEEGFDFISWGGDISSTNKNTVFTMNKDKKITANFRVKPVTLPDDHITITYNGSNTFDIDFKWNEIRNPNISYQVALSSHTENPNFDEIINTESKSEYKFEDVDATTDTLYLYVRALDNIGNFGEWTKSESFDLEVSKPSFSLFGKAYIDRVGGGTPLYEVHFDFADELEAEYFIKRRVKGDTDSTLIGNYTREELPTTDTNYQILSDNDLVRTEDLEAHETYEYFVYFLKDGAYSETSKASITIPNIPLSEQIDFIDITLSNSDLIVENLIPEYEYRTNDRNFILNISNNDLEGDMIEYQLYLKDDTNPFFDGWQQGRKSFSFNGSGQYQWYLKARDVYKEDDEIIHGEEIRIPASEDEYFILSI